MNFLLVEDDRSIARFLRRGMEAEGHRVEWTGQGGSAIDYASHFDYDAIILDLTLPDVDGIEVCRRLRQLKWDLPILILSARDQVGERIKGLNAGADDFLVKPFVFEELLARLSAIQRRVAPPDESCLAAGPIALEPKSRTVRVADRKVELTTREFKLLECLAKSHDKVVSRAAILSQVWGAAADVSDNAVDVYVGYLRRKLDLGDQLVTVRGLGFKLSMRGQLSR
jgi:DNA-binding response OmpR family regulator